MKFTVNEIDVISHVVVYVSMEHEEHHSHAMTLRCFAFVELKTGDLQLWGQRGVFCVLKQQGGSREQASVFENQMILFWGHFVATWILVSSKIFGFSTVNTKIFCKIMILQRLSIVISLVFWNLICGQLEDNQFRNVSIEKTSFSLELCIFRTKSPSRNLYTNKNVALFENY